MIMVLIWFGFVPQRTRTPNRPFVTYLCWLIFLVGSDKRPIGWTFSFYSILLSLPGFDSLWEPHGLTHVYPTRCWVLSYGHYIIFISAPIKGSGPWDVIIIYYYQMMIFRIIDDNLHARYPVPCTLYTQVLPHLHVQLHLATFIQIANATWLPSSSLHDHALFRTE